MKVDNQSHITRVSSSRKRSPLFSRDKTSSHTHRKRGGRLKPLRLIKKNKKKTLLCIYRYKLKCLDGLPQLKHELKSPCAHFKLHSHQTGRSWLTFNCSVPLHRHLSTTRAHTLSLTHTLTVLLTLMSKSQAPPLCVTPTVFFFGSCDLALYRLWALWFWICISSVHLCTLQLFCTEVKHTSLWGERDEAISVVTLFRPFLTEGTRALVSSHGCFLSPLFVFYRRSDASFSSFMCSEINLMNTKIYSSCDLEGEDPILLFPSILWVQKDLCMSPLLNWRNAMYVFWLTRRAKRQGKPFQFGGQ